MISMLIKKKKLGCYLLEPSYLSGSNKLYHCRTSVLWHTCKLFSLIDILAANYFC